MKKVLFISIVPPFPNDQGNRIYTLSFMEYLVTQGYHIDGVFRISTPDKDTTQSYFGDKVKIHKAKVKDYPLKEDFETRDKIKNLLEDKYFEGYNEEIKREIFYAANHFHPFEYISDDMIYQAKKLLEKNEYDYIVCNYIYTLRAVKELKEFIKKSKVIAITIDAVSRLDIQAYEYNIDTSYRACSPKVEAWCLNHADKVLAISQSEYDYFKSIGVDNVTLCEYNAYDFFKDKKIEESNFEKKTIFIAASGNPLNKLGLEHFLNRVWPGIYHMDNSIKMVVCGTICDHFDLNYKSIEFKGKVSSEELDRLMSEATITVNPAFLGTGLKIKSVESMCVGLPMVTFDEGVDGLQQFDDKAFLIAKDWVDFGDKILKLMNDKELWFRLHNGALEISKKRFTSEEVFKNVL